MTRKKNDIESEQDTLETQENMGSEEDSSQTRQQKLVTQSTTDLGTLIENLQTEEVGMYQGLGEGIPISSEVHQTNTNKSLWTIPSQPGIIQCDLLLGCWTS